MILPDGTPVYISPLLGPRPVPMRRLVLMPWMMVRRGDQVIYRAYHKRVQKKWNKRYGTKMMDQVIKTKDGIFISKEGYEKLREAFLK